MKKLVLVIMLVASGLAQADYREYRHNGHRDVRVQQVASADIIFPMVIGGIFGAAIANANRPEPIILQQQPVIVQQQPVYIQREQVIQPRELQTVCYGWKEFQTLDGQIYRERSCYLR
jgi:hypothetical protein